MDAIGLQPGIVDALSANSFARDGKLRFAAE